MNKKFTRRTIPGGRRRGMGKFYDFGILCLRQLSTSVLSNIDLCGPHRASDRVEFSSCSHFHFGRGSIDCDSNQSNLGARVWISVEKMKTGSLWRVLLFLCLSKNSTSLKIAHVTMNVFRHQHHHPSSE